MTKGPTSSFLIFYFSIHLKVGRIFINPDELGGTIKLIEKVILARFLGRKENAHVQLKMKVDLRKSKGKIFVVSALLENLSEDQLRELGLENIHKTGENMDNQNSAPQWFKSFVENEFRPFKEETQKDLKEIKTRVKKLEVSVAKLEISVAKLEVRVGRLEEDMKLIKSLPTIQKEIRALAR